MKERRVTKRVIACVGQELLECHRRMTIRRNLPLIYAIDGAKMEDWLRGVARPIMLEG